MPCRAGPVIMPSVNAVLVLSMYLCVQVPGLSLHVCQSLVTSTLANLSSEPFMNVEVMLRLFFLLGESISEKVNERQCSSSFNLCIQQFGSAAKPESPFHSTMAMVRG